MFTHKRALWEKNQCFSNLVFLCVMNKTVVWSPKKHQRIMKYSYLSCFHMVSLTEEKWCYSVTARRKICVLHMLLETLSWWGEWVPQLCAWKQGFHSVFHKLILAQEELLQFQQVVGCRKGWTLVWLPKRGSWSFLYPPPSLAFCSRCCMRCSPYRSASTAWEMLFMASFQALLHGQCARTAEI